MSQMSEIEKASEEQDTFRLRERAADARVIAAREKASKWHAKMEKAAEDRIREIAREEIEAAGAGAWVCGACGAVPSPTCPHRGVAPQCGVLVRASDFAIPGDPFNQEGGDANSPGRHERPATGLDKSPPAVEAPAAGEDTTALARRLAEALNKIWLSGEPEAHEREVESALTEARKAGLIE